MDKYYLIPKRDNTNTTSVFDLFDLDFETLAYLDIDKMIADKLDVSEQTEILYDDEVKFLSYKYSPGGFGMHIVRDTIQIKPLSAHRDEKPNGRETIFYLCERERSLFDQVTLLKYESNKGTLQLKASFPSVADVRLTEHVLIEDLGKLIDDISGIYGEDYNGKTCFSTEEATMLVGYNCTWSRQWNGIRIYLDSSGIHLQLFLFALLQ